jgi:two-component system cell cycle response regulator
MARILIIEDNATNLELMTYLLKAFGHVTLTAKDGEEGIATAMRELPDLIVCDIHLPKIDGHEVAKRLKQVPSLAGVPLVAVTALAMVGDKDRVLASGFDGYQSKPIDPQSFVGQLEHYLPPSHKVAVQRQWTTSEEGAPRLKESATILVVDDMPVNREVLRQTLEPLGYQVHMAETIADGLAIARQIKPDLILSDQELSQEDGFDFLSQVRADALLAATPFLLLSSAALGRPNRERALKLGATRFIERPIEPALLLSEISACLNHTEGRSNGDDTHR